MAEYSKKRNTYFLYDVLIRKYIKTLYEGNVMSKVALNVTQEYFHKDTILGKERKIFEQILKVHECGLSPDEQQTVIRQCKEMYGKINKKRIFEEQTRLLNKMAFLFNKAYLNEHVENYKLIANIWQYLNGDDIAECILIEKKILSDLNELKEVIVEKKVSDKPERLFESQEKTIALYESDNPGLFVYLNDQIKFMKEVLLEHSVCSECEVCDVNMKSGIIKLYHRLEEFRKEEVGQRGITEQSIQLILKLQDFVEYLKKQDGGR